ncbi:MAG: HRDC domain-containing protein [Pseudomonadota bacterium]
MSLSNARVHTAVQQRLFIDDDTGLAEHMAALNACTSIGLDTEFVRDRTFFPKPGLLQFSDGETIWLIDPIALSTSPIFRSWLADRMAHSDQVKILHSVGEDFEVLELLCGHYPTPLFDTQIAAALLGHPLQMRYEVLAEALLGLHFPGGKARNNWCQRPLPDAWTEYASHDVIALPAMREELTHRLQQAGRLEWHQEDCARSVQRASQVNDPVQRIKAASRLDDASLALLMALSGWRDQQARQRDLPRSFVLNDQSMLAMTKKRPQTAAELKSIDGLRPGFIRRHSDAILAITRAQPAPFTRPAALHPISADQQQRIKHMQHAVAGVAEELQLEAPLLASRRDLTLLVLTGEADWLDGWRAGVLEQALAPWR